MRVRELRSLTAIVFALLVVLTTSFCSAASNSQSVIVPIASGGAISPTRPQQQALARLVADDPEAHALFATLLQTAQDALTETPQPIAAIRTEGKLPQDPLKIATQHSLRDIGRIGALGWAAALTGDPNSLTNPYTAKAKEYILAWADTNISRGDPIDDTNLERLFVTYDLVRGAFSPEEQGRVELWLRQVAQAEQRTGRKTSTTTRNNWNSHRLKVIGLIAFLLHDPSLIANVVAGYRRQVAGDLDADGSSFDFHERDALHYHLYTLEPLLTLAIDARRNGIDLYDYQAPSGASLPKSLQFLVPYCDGTKTHAEFVGSKVAFDRKRAEAGDPHYRAGRLFDPHQALSTLALAAAFDAQYESLERDVSDKKTARFVSWQDVLNAVGKKEARNGRTEGMKRNAALGISDKAGDNPA